jgi:hypothetical protein
MRRFLLTAALALAIAPAHAETSAPTAPCIPYAEGDTVTVTGQVALTRQVEEEEGEPPHNYYEIVLEVPLCFKGGGGLTLTSLPMSSLKREMLGHILTVTGTMEAGGDSVYLNEKSVSEPNPPSPPSKPVTLDRSMLCSEIIDNGWYDMPDTYDYILSKPHADKLGYLSSCHLDTLVFSQCWLEPKITIGAAIDMLLKKGSRGQKLPDVPACGA